MKTWGFIVLLSSCFFGKQSAAQTHEIQQLLLDVEKLAQLKNMLTDLKKGYEIISAGYGTIREISKGTFDLHKAFLDRLLAVSPVVRAYKKIGDIVTTETRIVGDSRKALRQFSESGVFAANELDYIGKVYSNLLTGSLNNLDALIRVVTAGALRMSDDERLNAIDAVWKDAEESDAFFKHFNHDTKILALQRTKERREINTQKNLYNIH